MASANFMVYDRTLRRIHMMNLVEALARERGTGFRASLVVNGRTGHPIMAETAIASVAGASDSTSSGGR